MAQPLFTWTGVEEWLAESAQVRTESDRFSATGVQLGSTPVPYRLDYELRTTAGWVTGTLDVVAVGSGWRRSLHLARDADGRWSGSTGTEGDCPLPEPAFDAGPLDGALDCDLGYSPFTNSMPILRHRLHRSAGAAEFTMALVSVPDLAVEPSPQRYEHRRTTPAGAIVGFSSRSFSAELTVDGDGFLLDYPGLARRVP